MGAPGGGPESPATWSLNESLACFASYRRLRGLAFSPSNHSAGPGRPRCWWASSVPARTMTAIASRSSVGPSKPVRANLEATARHPAGTRAACRERRGDRRREEPVPFVREQPFRHFVAGSERMGDPHRRPRSPESALGRAGARSRPVSRASREVEDLDMRIRHPNRLRAPPAGGCPWGVGGGDLFISAEVQVEPEHPLPAGRRNGAALARAFDPPCSGPGAFPGRHVQHLAGQAEDGERHGSRRGGNASRDRTGHPEGGLERAPVSQEGETARGDAGNGELSLGRRGSRARATAGPPVFQGAARYSSRASRAAASARPRGDRHQLVPGDSCPLGR